MIAIIDYGVGNLFSLSSSLRFLGLESLVTSDPFDLSRASHIILPGVGAFGDAMRRLHASGLAAPLLKAAEGGKPLLGICLGMQMLFTRSYEYGEHAGLGLISGEVCPLAPDLSQPLKIPHIGWNRLQILRKDPIFSRCGSAPYVYYVHSFYAKGCADCTLAVSDYSIPVTGLVRRDNIYGAQFHPEKSGAEGLAMLRAFCNARPSSGG